MRRPANMMCAFSAAVAHLSSIGTELTASLLVLCHASVWYSVRQAYSLPLGWRVTALSLCTLEGYHMLVQCKCAERREHGSTKVSMMVAHHHFCYTVNADNTSFSVYTQQTIGQPGRKCKSQWHLGTVWYELGKVKRAV